MFVVRKIALSFRSKVVIITLLIVLGCQAGAAGVVLFATSRSVSQSADEQIATALSTYETLIGNRARLLKQAAIALGRNQAFRNAVADNDLSGMRTEIANHAEVIDADIYLISDERGNLITSNLELSDARDALTQVTTENHSSVAIDGSYYELFSVPVANGDELRWASLGHILDNALAEDLADLVGMDLTVFAVNDAGSEARMIATSLAEADRRSMRNMSRQIMSGAEHTDSVEKLRKDYRAYRRPFVAGVQNVFAVLQRDNADVMAAYTGMRGSILHGASTSVIFAMVLAFLLSRIATNDIRRLLLGARKIRVGNYGHEIEVRSKDEFGELASALNTMRESIAEREQRIRHQAEFDTLTGLPNRRKALQMIDSEIRKGAHSGSSLVVMIMHLGRFREIQSSLGYEIGDEVLNQTAAKIRAELDESITLGRLEGDQLLIIAPEMDLKEGWQLAESVRRTIDAGLNIKSINVTLEACIGFCVCPQHGRKASELLSHASVAKDDAQQSNQSVQVYQNGREASNFRRLTILGDLRRAALENELELFLQPKANIQTNVICGAEILLRWNHPDLGSISPQEFIPLAESAGSIETITDWVLCRGISLASRLAEAGVNPNIAINVSARDVEVGRLPDLIYQELVEHNMDPGCLTLEVTEEAVVRNIAYASKMMNEFRLMGIKTAMDDFGIGYSSLSQLQQLPLDELKIDKTFVNNLPENKHNAAIVKAVIDMAHNLGLEVVAEGVETAGALNWLRNHGCERAQGYYFSPPMPADDYIDWLNRWEKLTSANKKLDLTQTNLQRLLPDIVG